MINYNMRLSDLPVIGYFAKRELNKQLQALIDLCGNVLSSGGYLHNNLEYALERVSKRGNAVYSWQYTSTSYTLYDAWNNEVNTVIPSTVVDFLLNTGNVKEFTNLTGGQGLTRRIEYINADTNLTVSETIEFYNRFVNMHPISRATFSSDPANKRIIEALSLEYLLN